MFRRKTWKKQESSRGMMWFEGKRIRVVSHLDGHIYYDSECAFHYLLAPDMVKTIVGNADRNPKHAYIEIWER